MGKQWACVPKLGRSLAHSGTQKAQSPAPIPSPAKMGATDTTRKQTRMGNLPHMSAKSTTQQSRERRSNDSVWKVKCFEEAGEKRLSPQWRVEPQMRIAFIAVVTALILLGTCAAAQEITNDYSKVDFAHFKTYAWAKGHGVDEPRTRASSTPSTGNCRPKG